MSIFGNLFDFNGDGKTDIAEELIGLEMLGIIDGDGNYIGDDPKPSDDGNGEENGSEEN